jgi:class 3 adenylate cyclase
MKDRPPLALVAVVFASLVDADPDEVARAHGGTLLKVAEGRAIATFDSMAAAVAAGRQLGAAGSAVGVAVGDVAWSDDDVHGLPLVLAARLSAAAATGQVLTTASAARLEGIAASPIGDLQLKGIPAPVAVVACEG